MSEDENKHWNPSWSGQKPKTKEELLPHMENQRSNTMPIIQTNILMEMLDQLTDMKELIQKTIPVGKLVPVGQISVGQGITELNPSIYITMPWKSVNIINNGPSAYFISMNENYIQFAAPVLPNDPLQVDLGRDGIKKILLTCTNPVTNQPWDPLNLTTTLTIFATK